MKKSTKLTIAAAVATVGLAGMYAAIGQTETSTSQTIPSLAQ